MDLDCTSLDTFRNGIAMCVIESRNPGQFEIQDIFAYFPRKTTRKIVSPADVIYLLTEYRAKEIPINLGVAWREHLPEADHNKPETSKDQPEVTARSRTWSSAMGSQPPQLDVSHPMNEKIKEELSG